MHAKLRRIINRLLIIYFLVVLNAICSTPLVGAAEFMSSHFSVDIPQGWRRVNTSKYLMVTKEGPFLQYVLIQRRPIDRQFKHTKKKIKKGMLPHEAAGIIVDEIAADLRVQDFKVVENTPATIYGHDGFKLLFSYKDTKGSSFRTLYYGFIDGKAFYNLRYNAAKRYYLDKDIKTFERILYSFKLL